MHFDRRQFGKLLLTGAVSTGALSLKTAASEQTDAVTLTLSNGLKTHLHANDSGYVAARLVLRSDAITPNGLAHLFEHTSCVGAAGTWSAGEVTQKYRDCIQDGNASTSPGILTWDATFLPRYLPEVIELLASMTLDQRFDVATVEAQARVVLQELYLDKYDAAKKAQRKFDRQLFGDSHPYVKETTEQEIEWTKQSTARKIQELREFSEKIRLPANMHVFLVGSLEQTAVENAVSTCFGRAAFAQGPLLNIPQVAVTRSYKGLTASSPEIERPMSSIKIAWNTGVRVMDDGARVLFALSQYLNAALFNELRDKDGDAYSPQVTYEPDAYSGIFTIEILSSKRPQQIEKRVFDVVDRVKADIDTRELGRMRDLSELKRRKMLSDNGELLDRIVDRVIQGASMTDFALDGITREEMVAAAVRYLPSHHHAYVRLALEGS